VLREAAQRHQLTLVTATDGNHGRAVAHMAQLLGLPALVFVPEVVSPEAAAAIAAEGAEVVTVKGGYDEAVAQAAQAADSRPDAALVQDTAWSGYEVVPSWIVSGYETLLAEVDEQLTAAGADGPDVLVVPAGVGSLAQAVVTYYRRHGAHHPALLAVEPDSAACILTSLRAGDLVSVPTAATNMAGLNCGTPSSLAWPILRHGLDAAVTVSDGEAAQAVSDLLGSGVSSGPSGAATLAGARAALIGSGAPQRRAELGVTSGSVIVLLSTEANPAL
jgi:diaminopropionate ammonia-lyase